MHTKLAGIVAVLMLSIGCAQADEIRRLSLNEAIEEGLAQNRQVKAAHYQAQAANAAARVAGAHYWPLLAFEESINAANTPTRTFMMKLDQARFTQNDFQINNLNHPATVSDFRTAVIWEQPLFVPAAFAERRMARQDAEQQQLAGAGTREQIAFRIFQTYLEVHKAKAHLQAVEQALLEARESRRLAQVRTSAGLGLKSDELRAETHQAAIEQQLLSARNTLTLARLQLGILIGRDPDQEIDTTPLGQLPPQNVSSQQLTDTALARRSDLLQAQAGFERADAARSAARSTYLPTVAGFASYQLNDHRNPFRPENDSWMAGVTLRWNLFDGFRRENRHEQASASRAASAELLEQTRREVLYQVKESILRQQEAEKRHEVARSSVAAAQEAARLLSRRFENALATMVELLDAQSALNQARAGLVESDAGRYLAAGRVWYAAGIFVQEVQK